MRRRYFHQLTIAIDQLLNTLLAGFADETLSSRAWRCRHQKLRWMVVCVVLDVVFFWQTDHCRQSYERELYGGHLPRAVIEEILAGCNTRS